ncbi:MAG: hypothetical protein GWP19_06660 [Planctomycetia bacterium]|nr:hypothetical protein [Planctomycetia bacterium]
MNKGFFNFINIFSGISGNEYQAGATKYGYFILLLLKSMPDVSGGSSIGFNTKMQKLSLPDEKS